MKAAGFALMLCIAASAVTASRIIETDSFREISNSIIYDKPE
jgi:hypothetical protein